MNNLDDGFEYGIMMRGFDDCDLHRGPMSKKDAEEWMSETREMFNRPGAKPDEVWWIVRRPVGEWEKFDGLG